MSLSCIIVIHRDYAYKEFNKMARNEPETQEIPEQTRIIIDGPGIKIERELTPSQLMAVLSAVLGAGKVTVSESSRGHQNSLQNNDLSLTEFFRSSNPKRNPDKIVTIAFYMQTKMGKQSFSIDELRPQFRSVGEPSPANFYRDFKWSIKNGWISEVHGQPGQYYVTRTGEDAVAAKFDDEVKKETAVTKSIRKRRKLTGESQSTDENNS
jgi:hypothetical protein